MDLTRPPKPRRLLRWLVGGVVFVAAVFIGGSAYYGVTLTNLTHRPVGPVPADFSFPVEAVRFNATDGTPLAGWYVPCPGATRAVVLLHGAKRNRLAMLPHAKLLRAHGYAVLLYDARGHGESAAVPTSLGWHETKDLLGAMDYLRGRGFQQFGLLGLSMGGITIALAADRLHDLSWVVLECTPARVMDIFHHDMTRILGPAGPVLGALVPPIVSWRLGVSLNDYVPLNQVANFHCPIFIMAGSADVRVRPTEARELFDRANEPKTWWLIPGAPHTNFYYYKVSREYEQRLLAFIDGAVKQPAAPLSH